MILIVDDDSVVRSSLTFLLKRAGFEPEAVPGPKEALEVVRCACPQLILMDMNFTLTTSGEEGLQLLSSEAITLLQRLPFSGNIRELKNLIERTMLVSGKSLLEK